MMIKDPVRLLALICGYDVHATPPPGWAAAAGLRKRFAIVLDPIRDERTETDFDVRLFLNLAPAIFKLMPHNSITIE